MGYEFLDHTADVQIHAWGDTLREAFEEAVTAMSAYITDIDTVNIVDKKEIEVEGQDLPSLLFRYLDEFLFLFNCDPFFITKRVRILEFDLDRFYIKAEGYGEVFSLDTHPQGTEIKAITYSNMQIINNGVYFIVDI